MSERTAMRIELEVRIDSAGTVAVFTRSELAARLPSLRLSIGEAPGRTAPGFLGRIVADGEIDAVRDVVARHLTALRQLSTEHPALVITVAELGGDALTLTAGSFGDDEAEVTALLARIVGETRWQLYASFRLSEPAQEALLGVVEEIWLDGKPVVHRSATAIALGFTFEGDRGRVVGFLAVLRIVWEEAGQGAEVLIELEGGTPAVQRLASAEDWRLFIRSLRPEPEPDVVIHELHEVPEVLRVLGSHGLTWLDGDEQIFGIVHGAVCALSARCELAAGRAKIRRLAGGAVDYKQHDLRVELPRIERSVARRLLAAWDGGALFADTQRASTQLVRVGRHGVDEGPALAHVRGLDADATDAFAIADGDDGVTLHAIRIEGWERWHARPWSTGETPTDLALLGPRRIAVTVEQGPRSRLYLAERANLVHARVVALPCIAPQIVGHGPRSVWITGLAPSPGAARCGLYRFDLERGTLTMLTAEIDEPTIDVVVDGELEQALLATPRAVYRWSGGPLEEVHLLARDEEVTGMALAHTTAVFVRGPDGARLVLGRARVSVPLACAGYAPRFSAI